MKLVELKIRGFNIAYYTNNQAYGTIVFFHGNSLSSTTFKHQFADKRLNRFKLLAIDFPGHGKSKWSENKEKDYSLYGLRDIVVELIKELNINEFVFAGHSLGGHVAIECLPFCKQCKGILIWGTPPTTLPLDTSQLFMPNPDMGLFFKQDLSGEELSKLAEITLNDEKKNFLIEIIKQADPQFRTYFPQSLAKGELSDEVSILKSSGIPVAILNGKDDPFINKDYMEKIDLPNIWKKKILLFENGGHSIQIENSLEFNEALLEFVNFVL